MTDDERCTRQPLSMTRRYRRGLILTGLLCALAVLTAATVLFQRSYAERIDNYLMQICHGYAAAYEAQDTHSAATLLNLLPENLPCASPSSTQTARCCTTPSAVPTSWT
ncbi:hypothetical protein NIA69_23075 [Gemmiger formicilis]|nr:hypothetical protein [Gemmiger formicilis]